jgi:glucokinase
VDVGVDVGGTKVLAAVVGEDGTPLRTHSVPTPPKESGARRLEQTLADAVQAVAAGHPVGRVGVAAAAFVDSDRRRAMFAPHLAWRGEPAAERLEQLLGAPVLLENDATCAAWAEATAGAARGAGSSLTVTVGTGIGGGIVLGDRLLRGSNGMAGEFGHVTVVPDGIACPCGGRGCWERYVSGAALLAAAVARGARGVRTGDDVTGAALSGDEAALGAFTELGGWLGRGLAGLVAVLDPEVVVVGGGVGASGELLLGPARARLARDVVGHGHRRLPDLRAAHHGPEAGLLGAVALARRELR